MRRAGGRTGTTARSIKIAWAFSAPDLRCFLRRGRRKAVVDEALGQEFAELLVSDFYAAYHHYDGPKQSASGGLGTSAAGHPSASGGRPLYPGDHRLGQWADAVNLLYRQSKAFTHASERQRRAVQLALCRPYLDDPAAAQARLCRRIENHIKRLHRTG